MNRMGTATITLAGLALAGMLVGATLHYSSHGSQQNVGETAFFRGDADPTRPLQSEPVEISDGGYLLGYAVNVQFESADPSMTITCGLADSSGWLQTGPSDAEQSTAKAGVVNHLYFRSVYFMPSTALRVLCAPSATGQLSLALTDLQLIIAKQP
jgi:hypothetical protein